MVSDINTPRPPDEARADTDQIRDAVNREASSARDEASKARSTVADEASRLASSARGKAYEGVESGKAYAASSLNDFTAAIRKASDELGERDQSMAANLVREAASGLEQVSGAIEGKSIQEITRSVAGFARRQPAAFLIGAALAGVAIGRFAKASSEHGEDDYVAGGSLSRQGPGPGSYDADRKPSYGDPSSSGGLARDYHSATERSSTTAGSAMGSSGTSSSAFSSPGGASAGSTFATKPTVGSGTPSPQTMGETARQGSVSSPGTASSTTPATSGPSTLNKGGSNES